MRDKVSRGPTPNGRGSDSSGKTREVESVRQKRFTTGFQHVDGDLPFDRRKLVQKLIQRVARFKVVEQRFHSYARTCEARRAAHEKWVLGNKWAFHGLRAGSGGILLCLREIRA